MKFDLAAEIREQAGKGVARQLRRRGRIPGVLYGQGECLLLTLDPEVVTEIVRGRAGSTALINLNITGATAKPTRTALLRDYQIDPVSGEVLHADLFEVSMTKAIRVKVPVSLVGGMPAGLKDGGVLHHNLREVQIECLPSALPDAIEVDASNLAINQGIHIRELPPREGLRFLDEPDQMVVSVAAPISEAKLEALLTSGAAVEEGKEPEVIGKGKEEPAAEGAEKAPAAEAKGGEKKAAPDAKAEKKEVKEEKKK
jgi:large subunit ribosomal protein L25